MILNLFDKIFLKKSLHEVAGRQDVARGREWNSWPDVKSLYTAEKLKSARTSGRHSAAYC